MESSVDENDSIYITILLAGTNWLNVTNSCWAGQEIYFYGNIKPMFIYITLSYLITSV